MVAWWRILIASVCLVLSGTFSGLTLGLMSLGVMDLRVLTESGTEKEKYYASKILPVRKHANFLLCTLLIGNTAVNSALSIVTADIFGGLAGFLSSTIAILYFGEIIPQAVCHRFGLVIGAYAIPIVKLFMVLTAILSYPTAKLLDYLLGHEPTTRYNKSQLRSLLSIHGNDQNNIPDLENGEGGIETNHREISPANASPVGHLQATTTNTDKKPSEQDPEEDDEEESMSSLTTTNDSPTAKNFFNIPLSLRRVRRRNGSVGKRNSGSDGRSGGKKKVKEDDKKVALLTRAEMAIFGGAFEFGSKNVSQIMTHIDKVFMLDASLKLNFNVMLIIFQSGHSRIPVYENDRSNVIGVLFAKDLILLDPEDSVPLKSILYFFNRSLVLVYNDTPLFDMLTIFKQGAGHLAIVQKVVDDNDADPRLDTLGVATLEDLIEELIGEDIVDETDVYTDNVSRKPVRRVRSVDTELLKMFDPLHNEERLTEKEVLVVASYLAHNTHEFSELCVRYKILREYLVNAPIEEYFDGNQKPKTQQRTPSVKLSPITGSFSPERNTATLAHTQEQMRLAAVRASESENPRASAHHNLRQLIGPKVPSRSDDIGGVSSSADGENSAKDDGDDIFIYKRGVPSVNAYLILSGRFEITAGNDGFRSEAGPWTLLGVHALVDDLYAPDFTARVIEKPARLLRISRRLYRLMQQYSGDSGVPLTEPTSDTKVRVSPHTLDPASKSNPELPDISPIDAISVTGNVDKQQPLQQKGDLLRRRVSKSTNQGRELTWTVLEPAAGSNEKKNLSRKIEQDIVTGEMVDDDN